MNALTRFHSKWIEDEDGCHIWQEESRFHSGYGRFTVGGRACLAHRWIYIYMTGDRPPVVMHRCDKRACVNWEKCLRGGTTADNVADRQFKGRQARGTQVHTAKLTDSEVQEIRDEYERGVLTQVMLAEAYGVDQTSISRYVLSRRSSEINPTRNWR